MRVIPYQRPSQHSNDPNRLVGGSGTRRMSTATGDPIPPQRADDAVGTVGAPQWQWCVGEEVMAKGWIRWVGLGGVIGLGLLPVACDQSAPQGQGPNGINPGEAPPSMALEAEPQTPNDLAAPPPPPPGSFLAQLSPDQVAQLTSLGVDVVVPGVVPPAFQVADLRISQGEMGLGYLIIYQNANRQCFAVEYTDSGTSPPPATQHRLPIQPPLFNNQDYGLNYGPFADPEWQAKFPGANLYTDWLVGRSGYYRLTGATDIKALFPALATCQDVEPQTAVALVESFTLITAEPTGAGL